MWLQRVAGWPNCFCRNRFGGTAVDMEFERGLVVDQVTGLVNDSVGQQRLHAVVQRVSTARGQQPVAARVEAPQEGLSEAMRHVLVASSTRESSVGSDADVVDKDQMGGEKPVSVIGSPMCLTLCSVIMTMMQDANRVSEVMYEILVQRCVRRPKEKEMLRENLWDRRFRGPNFAIKMSEETDVRETQSELCRSQSAMCLPKEGSCFKSRSECAIEELRMCSYNEADRQGIT